MCALVVDNSLHFRGIKLIWLPNESAVWLSSYNICSILLRVCFVLSDSSSRHFSFPLIWRHSIVRWYRAMWMPPPFVVPVGSLFFFFVASFHSIPLKWFTRSLTHVHRNFLLVCRFCLFVYFKKCPKYTAYERDTRQKKPHDPMCFYSFFHLVFYPRTFDNIYIYMYTFI